MADRLNYQAPFLTVQELPNVNVDTGHAQYFKTLSNVFLTNAGEAHKRQLAADLELAKTEGGRVGYENGKNFQPMKPTSLFARQYNDSGISTALENIQMDTQKTAKSYFEKNKMNPTQLSKDLDSYSKGYISKLAPEMQTSVKMHLDKMGASLVETAKSNLKTYNAQVAAAKFEAYDREMENTLEVIAPSMFAGGEMGKKAQESVAELRNNYASTLAHHGPRGKYNAGGYDIDGSKTGSGAWSPKEVSEKMRAFDMRVLSAGVYGHFVQEAEEGRGVDAYMSFLKGDMEVTAVGADGKLESKKIKDILLNDEMDKLASKMRTYANGVDSMEDAVHKKWQRARERHNDQVLRTGYEAAYQVEDVGGQKVITGGDPAKLNAMISSAVQDPMVQPETIVKLQALAEQLGASGAIDDPRVKTSVFANIAAGYVSSYQDLPTYGLSDKTRIEAFKQIDQRLKGEHWSNSNRYKVAADYADAVLAPAKSAGFNIFGNDDGSKASAADRAEWEKLMISDILAAEQSGTLPTNPNAFPQKRADGSMEFDFVARGRELADQIAARRTKTANVPPAVKELDEKIKAVETQMENPKPGDDTDAIKAKYRKYNEERAALLAKEAK